MDFSSPLAGEDARKGRRGERERSERAFASASEFASARQQIKSRPHTRPYPLPASGEEKKFNGNDQTPTDKKKPRLAPGFLPAFLAAFDQKVTLQLLM